jgi:hypothetical protein
MYHQLADKVFGLGEYIPKTTIFNHPFTNIPHSAMEFISQAKKFKDIEQLKGVKNPQDLYKLGVMDTILGNNDRHRGNVLFTKDGDIRLIDHGMTFDYNNLFSVGTPSYLEHIRKETIPPEVHSWIKDIDPKKMIRYLIHRGAPDFITKNALKRLLEVQRWSEFNRLRRGSLEELRDAAYWTGVIPKDTETQINDKIDKVMEDLGTTKLVSGEKK